MQTMFATNKEDFELLVRMFEEDSNLRSYRLKGGAFRSIDEKADLPPDRDEQYRDLLIKLNLKWISRVIVSGSHTDIHLQAWWVKNGWIQSKSKDFVYTKHAPLLVVDSLDEVYESGRDANHHKKIDENWYLYLDVW
jgi:hypothetical protein